MSAPPGGLPAPPHRRVERAAKRVAIGALAGLFPSPPITARPDLGAVRRVLVVRPHNERGDMLLMVPLLRALREALPGREIALLASLVNEAVVRRNPYVDRLLVLDANALRWRPWGWVSFLRRLRRWRPDLAVLPNTVSYSVTSAVLARLSGARLRCGTDSRGFGHQASRYALNLVAPHPGEERHETERNLAALRPLGITTRDLTSLYVPSEEAQAAAESYLASRGEGAPLVLLHVGAGKIPNRWPAERFGELAARLRAEGLARPVLAAGPAESELLARAREASAPEGTARGARSGADLLGARSLDELAAIARRAALYVGNDTGPLHLAAAAGARALALLGPTDPGRWLPRGARVRFLRAPAGDLRNLPVETVWQEVRPLLARRAGGVDA